MIDAVEARAPDGFASVADCIRPTQRSPRALRLMIFSVTRIVYSSASRSKDDRRAVHHLSHIASNLDP